MDTSYAGRRVASHSGRQVVTASCFGICARTAREEKTRILFRRLPLVKKCNPMLLHTYGYPEYPVDMTTSEHG
jgi:hypothetical protein